MKSTQPIPATRWGRHSSFVNVASQPHCVIAHNPSQANGMILQFPIVMKSFKLRRPVKILLIIVLVLVVIRIALAPLVLHFANKTLSNMDGYRGHIDDIDIALIRGAYRIDSIYLNKLDSVTGKETPFFSASEIDLSVEWKALFKGSIVGELVFERPVMKFTKDKVEPKDVTQDSTDFRKLLKDFMPLQVNRVEINNGNVQYLDHTSTPKVDVHLTNLDVLALNLKNSYDSSELLPASIKASADIYEGTLTFNMKLNPLADDPTFDMNAELKGTNLVLLNDFFKAYAKIDVNKGTFGMYTEVAAKEGRFEGYVKPLIKDLDVVGAEDRDDNVFRQLWENIAGTVAEVLENQRKDQFATKVPLEGNIKNPESDIASTILTVLQNAFIQALQPAIDDQISIGSVDDKEEKKGFLERVFNKDDKKEDDSKDPDKKSDKKAGKKSVKDGDKKSSSKKKN